MAGSFKVNNLHWEMHNTKPFCFFFCHQCIHCFSSWPAGCRSSLSVVYHMYPFWAFAQSWSWRAVSLQAQLLAKVTNTINNYCCLCLTSIEVLQFFNWCFFHVSKGHFFTRVFQGCRTTRQYLPAAAWIVAFFSILMFSSFRFSFSQFWQPAISGFKFIH